MNEKRIVVALGKKAFGASFQDEKQHVKLAAEAIGILAEEKYEMAITFSNSAQVGMIHGAMKEYSRVLGTQTAAPMSVCAALSQGYIGYDLQNAIRTELLNRGIYKTVSTIITQTRVDPFDEAFAEPSKVIGRYLTEEEAETETEKGNYVVKTEQGYRRIVAAPKPVDIYEIDAIRALLDAGQFVIAAGGGGIPVLQQGTRLKGASAIIEKDLAAARLADLVDASMIVFLSGMEKLDLNYGGEEPMYVDKLTLEEAKKYLEEGKFTEGGMKPKIAAAIEFISADHDRKVLISDICTIDRALAGKTGTLITY